MKKKLRKMKKEEERAQELAPSRDPSLLAPCPNSHTTHHHQMFKHTRLRGVDVDLVVTTRAITNRFFFLRNRLNRRRKSCAGQHLFFPQDGTKWSMTSSGSEFYGTDCGTRENTLDQKRERERRHTETLDLPQLTITFFQWLQTCTI